MVLFKCFMLEKDILNTIKYFNIFEYPLTAWECYHWLYSKEGKVDYLKVEEVLKQFLSEKKVGMLDGFYFLPGKDIYVQTRQRRYLLSQLKFSIARRAVKIIRALPFIKYIAVCNSLAYNNTTADSDIDLFIITKAHAVWRGRFLAATLMQLLHWRPNKKTSKDKICLSFFITDENLNLQPLSLDEDIYFKYWLIHLVPLYDPENLQNKLLEANDQWLRKTLPNYITYQTSKARLVKDNFFSKLIKKILEVIFAPKSFESFLRYLQFNILSDELKNIANKDTRVVMNDQILKFHLLDRRIEYRDKFKASIDNV